MRYGLLGLLSAVALLSSGCALFSSKDGTEPMELEKIDSTARISQDWSRRNTNGQGVGFARLTPAVAEDRIYVADHRGHLVVYDRRRGRLLWSRRTGESFAGGVGLGAEQLLLSNFDGEVIALSKTDGRELWRTRLSGEIMSAPSTNDRLVAVQTLNGKLYALDAQTGEVNWFYESQPPSLTLRGNASPVLTDSSIYAGFANGRMMAFDARNGLIQWEQRISMPGGRSELDRMVDIHATPVLRSDTFYVGSYQGNVMALTRGSGRPLWSQDASTHQPLMVTEETIYVSMADGTVVALDAGSGDIVWRNEQLLRRGLTNPVVLGDYLAVMDYKGYMHLLNRSDGEFAARRRFGRKAPNAPLLPVDGKVLLYGNNGRLRMIEAEARK